MSARRFAGLPVVTGLFAAGCGSSEPPPPPAPEVNYTAPLDPGDGSLIRRGEGAAPKEEPTPPKPGEIVLPADGGTWPWNLAPAPPPAASRPVTIPGYVYPSSTTAGVVVSPAARRAVVLVAERGKDEA